MSMRISVVRRSQSPAQLQGVPRRPWPMHLQRQLHMPGQQCPARSPGPRSALLWCRIQHMSLRRTLLRHIPLRHLRLRCTLLMRIPLRRTPLDTPPPRQLSRSHSLSYNPYPYPSIPAGMLQFPAVSPLTLKSRTQSRLNQQSTLSQHTRCV